MLLLADNAILFFDLPGDLSPSFGDLSAASFFLFLLSDLLVEFDSRLPFQVEPLHVLELVCLALGVLLALELGLLGLLVLAHEDRLLDFGFLDASLLANLENSLTACLGDHLLVLHFLHLFCDAHIVAFLESHDFTSALLGLLDLLPSLHLLLLEKSDAVGKELCISLDILTLFLRYES